MSPLRIKLPGRDPLCLNAPVPTAQHMVACMGHSEALVCDLLRKCKFTGRKVWFLIPKKGPRGDVHSDRLGLALTAGQRE